ncbi:MULTISPECIES: LLM class flavin-dependent oxidoreductase [unclassified Paenibacillus]|uniref:LLM class flavin-dependent oxidoreductase n=1 Tax=unclassified Paenibacillus TaxID=185978 RepID=UPI00020D7C20|nr:MULTISPECIES: LLM class flavin-dependent oxidoreductase [unclassified Paenibacillus]EGL16723.1 luciferase family oxidoreductase, FMN-dependent, PP_0088 family [Paenibacillus sp. HGF7]EPD80675.1 luciferase family oxidoreductase, group 1 [Paenibacillus sp. HGH0039]
MRLSILDQSPISSNQTANDALIESMKLAQAGEALGYTRYWIAEHHDLPGLACSAPEVMLSYIGANTNRIRIGSGAVLLPYYRPYKVAEVFNMLATLFPHRIDLGIGRAPGGSAEATNALSDNFLQKVWELPALVKELLHFLEDDFSADHEYSKISASPIPENSPVPWLLGTSEKSALLAARNGMSYTFGHFMSDNDGIAIIQAYRDAFRPRKEAQTPQVIVTVSAICGETTEQAEEIAESFLIWSLQTDKGEGHQRVPSVKEAKQYKITEKEKDSLNKMKQNMIIGNPHELKRKLMELQTKYQADEIMINTITYSPKDRIHSYKLIAKEIFSKENL